MSGMKSQLLAFAALASMAHSGYTAPTIDNRSVEEKAKFLERKRAANADKLKASKGLTKFNYGWDRDIWALNQKNADKKAKKKGWL